MAKRRNRVFLWFERTVLGIGMTLVAFVIERRLIKAIKKGSVEPAPRTAADEDEPALGEASRPVEVATHPQR